MTQNEKHAWGNVVVWGMFLIASGILLAINRTIFFWQDDAVRNSFYIITGIAIASWFVMMLIVWLMKPGRQVVSDERDSEIMSRVNAAAGPIAMSAVAIVSLVLIIIYLDDKNSVISPYFLIYIMLTNIIVYWLVQAVITLIAYRKS